MPGARGGIPLLASFLAVGLVGACTTVGPLSTPGASAPVGASVGTSAAPTDQPVESAGPPTSSAKPSKKPRSSSAPAGPSAPNLVITKFALGADQFVVGYDPQAKITVKNTGNADATIFDVSILYEGALGGHGLSDPVTVDGGLAAGEAIQLTVPFGVQAADTYTLTAIADQFDDVAESNEEDNRLEISTQAISLPNLTVKTDSFTVQEANGSYAFSFVAMNTGTADASEVWSYRYFWYTTDGQSGVFGEFELDFFIDAGNELPIKNTIDLIGPGDYLAYVLLDSKEQIPESDETDNEARYDFSVQ